MDDSASQIGKKLRQAREMAGLTQVEAAAGISVDTQTVSRWERGTRKPGAADYVKALEYYTRTAQQRAARTSSLVQSAGRPERLPLSTDEWVPEVRESTPGKFEWRSPPVNISDVERRAIHAGAALEREVIRLGASDEEADFIRSRVSAYRTLIHSGSDLYAKSLNADREWQLYLEAVLKRLVIECLEARRPDPAPARAEITPSIGLAKPQGKKSAKKRA